MKAVVSDTGPLIALAKVDRLALLKMMFDKVLIPPAVWRELMAKSGPESARLDAALNAWIEVTPEPPLPAEVKVATSRLDRGEQQAIALAHERQALLIIDDCQGREAARCLGVMLTGVIGVLLHAKERGDLSAVRPLLAEMRQQGYWLSDEVLDVAARLAGEA